MASFYLFLFGYPQIERDGIPVKLTTRKALACLAYLATMPDRQSRNALIALLWPTSSQSQGRTTLRHILYTLKNTLGHDWLIASRETIELNPELDLHVDVCDFRRLRSECQQHGHPDDAVCHACIPLLRRAVELYRDAFLAGFTLRNSVAFDDWQYFQSEQSQRELAESLERLVMGLSATGACADAITLAHRWLALDSLQESAHRALMQLYAWTGQRERALKQYHDCCRVLQRTLTIEPLATTVELFEFIKSGQTPPLPNLWEQAEDRQNRSGTIGPGLTRRAEAWRTSTILAVAATDTAIETSITNYGGQVVMPVGDRIVAAFGLERQRENDPELAIRAAFEIRQIMRAKSKQVAIGIATGVVARGTFATFGAVGLHDINSPLGAALRLQTDAEPASIWVGESTYRLTRHTFEFTPQSRQGKNVDLSLRAYEVTRLKLPSGKMRGIEGLKAPLIGRERAQTDIKAAVEAWKTGAGQLVTITGVAGIGKSRLIVSLKTLMAESDDAISTAMLWLEGRCLQVETPPSYWLFRELLRTYFAWDSDDALPARAERIVEALQALTDDGALAADRLAEMSIALYRLFGLAAEETSAVAVSPEEMKVQTCMAVRDLIVAISRREPLVLVLEDLHWADSLSMDLLSLLMDLLPQERVLILCGYRPEPDHRAWQCSALATQKCIGCYTDIRLVPLTEGQSYELINALLDPHDLPASIQTLIIERAQGNPFVLEELIYTLIDSGRLVQTQQRWRLTGVVEGVSTPKSVQQIILSRFDYLGPDLQHLLQIAAVIGPVFHHQHLAKTYSDQNELESALWRLQERAWIYQASAVPETAYAFRHGLTHETIYHHIDSSRRVALHQQVAAALEAISHRGGDAHVGALAYHYLHGDELEKALPCFLSAAEKAVTVYANQEALMYFGQAVEVGQTIGGTALTLAQEAAQRRGWLHFSLMNCPSAIADFERAGAIARLNRDRRLEGLALAYRGWAEGWNHEFEKAERTSKVALRVAADLRNNEIRLFASITLGLFLYGTNRLAEARPYLALSEELAKRVEDPLSQFWWGIVGWHRPAWEGRFDDALSHLAYWRQAMEQSGNVFGILGNQWLEAVVLGGKGEYTEAMSRLQDVLATAERIGDQFWRVRAFNTIGWLYGELYDYERAIVWNTDGIRAAQEAHFPDPEVECNARLNVADNWMATGRLHEAEAQFQYVETIVRNPRSQDHLDLWRYAQHLFHSYGELWLCRGDYAKAFDYADACLSLADPGFSQKYQVKGRRLRGEVLIAQGHLTKAERELDMALQTAVALGNPPQLWKTQARRAELRLRQGRSSEARQAFEAVLAEIEAVAAGLMDETLRTRFLGASDIQHIRQMLEQQGL